MPDNHGNGGTTHRHTPGAASLTHEYGTHLTRYPVKQIAVALPEFCQELSSLHALDAGLPDELVEDDVVDVLLLLDQLQQVVHLCGTCEVSRSKILVIRKS